MTQKKGYAFSILIKETEKAIKENIDNGTIMGIASNY